MYHNLANTLNTWLLNDNWDLIETSEQIQKNLNVGKGVAHYIYQSIRELINRGGDFTGEDVIVGALDFVLSSFAGEIDAREWLEIYKAREFDSDFAFYDGYGWAVSIETFEEIINLKWGK